MSKPIKKILSNSNFVNNQNYIFDNKRKVEILSYAYTTKQKATVFNKRKYYLQNINDWRFKTWKLQKWNAWYIQKLYWLSWIRAFFRKHSFVMAWVFSLLTLCYIIFFWWIMTSTTVINWVQNSRIIDLWNLSLSEKITELKFFFIIPFIPIIVWWIRKKMIAYEVKKYYIFSQTPDADKIIIYKIH